MHKCRSASWRYPPPLWPSRFSSTSVGTTQCIYTDTVTDGTQIVGFALRLLSSKLEIKTGNNADWDIAVTGGTTLSSNTVYHAVAVIADGAQTLYVNGVSDGTGTRGYTPVTSTAYRQNISSDLIAHSNPFIGTIQDVAVYGTLTATQVLNHYNAGTRNLAAKYQLTADSKWWLTNNTYPELNTPLDIVTDISSAVQQDVQSFKAIGRDYLLTSQTSEKPATVKTFNFMIYGEATTLSLTGEPMSDILRENLEHSTKKPSSWALLGPDGQKYYGIPTINAVGTEATSRGVLVKGNLNFIENSKDPETSVDYQGPSFLRLDGTTGYITHGDQEAGDFYESDDFTVLAYASIRSGTTANAGLVEKYSATAGWLFGTDGADTGKLQFYLDGVTTGAGKLASATDDLDDGITRV